MFPIMRTTISSDGRVTLPNSVLKRLGIQAGDELDIAVASDRLVLTRPGSCGIGFRQGTSAISGLPVLEARKGVAELTTAQVAELSIGGP